MNKKGIIALIIVIVLVVVAYLAFSKSDKTTDTGSMNSGNATSSVPENVNKDDYAPVTSASTDTSLIGRLKKASVGVTEDGKKVALSNGTASFTIDGTNQKATVTLGDIAVEQSVNGRNDALATVTVSQSGSSYTYIVLFEDKGGVLTDKSYGLVGQDAKVTGLRADAVENSGDVEYVVTTTYTSGSTSKSKFFIVEKGVFNLAKTIEL